MGTPCTHQTVSPRFSRTGQITCSYHRTFHVLTTLQIRRLDKVASRSYPHSMRSVGLKTLKNKLSEYVRLAAGGETVLVTDREKVVAELVPPRESRSPLLADALLADAVRRGWLTPPSLPPGTPPPPAAGVAPLAQVLAELSADRDR